MKVEDARAFIASGCNIFLPATVRCRVGYQSPGGMAFAPVPVPPGLEHRDPMMWTPAPCLLIAASLLAALAAVACDRRDLQPRQESETTDSVILDPAATDPDAALDPLPPPATSPCAGMSGQAETDCRARESARRAGDVPPPGDTTANEDLRR